MYRFWQNNKFYKGWKDSKKTLHHNKPKSTGGKYDFSKVPLIKLFPESDEDIYDAFNEKEGFGHQLDALKHCVDNKIPFLRWNGMLYDWHQNRIK